MGKTWRILSEILERPGWLATLFALGFTYKWGFIGLTGFITLFILLNIFSFVIDNRHRYRLIRNKELIRDSESIQWLCKHGVHTYAPVKVDPILNDTTRYLVEEIHRARTGERRALCCHKKQSVWCFINSNTPHVGENCSHCKHKEHWSELPKELHHWRKLIGAK